MIRLTALFALLACAMFLAFHGSPQALPLAFIPFMLGTTKEVGGYSTHDAIGAFLRIIHVILSPAIVNTVTAVEQTFTVPEVLITDVFGFSNKPTTNSGVIMGQGRVSAANQVALTFVNPTAGGVTPTASQEYVIGIVTDRGA